LKLGTSKNPGTVKMNLASPVTPTSIVVNAKLYNSTKSATLKVNGSATQDITSSFSDLTFSITSEISYIELTSSKYCWISSVTVNYASADTRTEVATIGNINTTSLAYGAEGTFTVDVTPADGLSASDYTVAWTELNDAKLTLLEDGSYEAGTTKGDVEVEVTVNPNNTTTYKPVSKTFTVNVYDPNAGDGSEARPFSVAEAIEKTPASGTSSSYYIKGNVSRFYNTSVMGDDTNYRYYISDDDGTTNELLVYRGKNIGNVAFTDASDLSVGDAVVIYGGLTTYSATKEIAANNYIVSLNGKKLSGIAYATSSYNTLPANTAFETPTLTNPNGVTVTYSTNDAEVADVNATTGVVTIGEKIGTATITATFAGNSSFLAATASYTITTARADANISFSEPSVTITKGDEFTAPTFVNPNSLTGVVFTSSYNDVATVSDAGVITLGGSTGTAVIKASYAQGVQYNEGVATCTITVNPAGVTPEPSATGYYEKVTDVSDIEDGQYLIVCEAQNKAFNGGLSTLDATQNFISIEVNADKIEESVATKAAEFSIEAITDGYSIKSTHDTYIGRTSNSNGFNTSDEALLNTISISSGNAIITSSAGPTLQYYNSGNNSRFRYYSSSQVAIQLYKFVAGAAPSYIDVYVSEAGYATYASNFDLDFTSVSGLKAYIAEEVSSEIKMVQVNKVPKETGVLLRATDGGGMTYKVPTAATTDDVTGNLFKRGNDAAVATDGGEGKTNYILNVVNNKLGFYKAAGNTVAKNKAYLQTTLAAARIELVFDEGTAGISNLTPALSKGEGVVYDLSGRRVVTPAKGLYIVNGKKVFVK